MSTRDEFASAALIGILASRTLRGPKQLPQDVSEAFDYADAMVAETEKRPQTSQAKDPSRDGNPSA